MLPDLYFKFYSLICIITFVIQIIAITKMKQQKEAKYWNIFVGITIANLIFIVIEYKALADTVMGLSGAVGCMMICGLSLVVNLILWLVGWLIKKSCKRNDIRLNKTTVLVGGSVLLINALIVFGISPLISNTTAFSDKDQVVSYLNNRYGDGNFEIVDVNEEYGNSGMWDKFLSGYIYEVKSSYTDDTFMVITNMHGYVNVDYFFPVYFSEQNDLDYHLYYDDEWKELRFDFTEFDEYIVEVAENDYAAKLYSSDVCKIYGSYIHYWNEEDGVEYNDNYYIVPTDGGEIPSIDVVVEGLVELVGS